LKGDRIPLSARIVAVAEAYDAMTQGRNHRKPLNTEEALAELNRNAGTKFDPRTVEALLSLLSDTGKGQRTD